MSAKVGAVEKWVQDRVGAAAPVRTSLCLLAVLGSILGPCVCLDHALPLRHDLVPHLWKHVLSRVKGGLEAVLTSLTLHCCQAAAAAAAAVGSAAAAAASLCHVDIFIFSPCQMHPVSEPQARHGTSPMELALSFPPFQTKNS